MDLRLIILRQVNAAILKFQQEVTDPKAMVLPTYNTVNTVVDLVRVPGLILAHPLSDKQGVGSDDSEIAAALLQSTNTIYAAAIAEGQNITDVAVYGNYALIGTPIESLYGKICTG
jgi:hypothetical protein